MCLDFRCTKNLMRQYKPFVERTIPAWLPDPQSEPEPSELEIYKKCRFLFGPFFSERTIISKLVDTSIDPEKRNEILDSRKSLLEKSEKVH